MRLHSDLSGKFKIEAFKADAKGEEIIGTRRVLADWFPNLITDGGLEQMANAANYLTWCQVGSGSTAPNVLDTALVTRVAGTSTIQSTSGSAQSTEPYYTWRRNNYRFAEGAAAGNLAEVGVGWASTGSLFSRALILDGDGNPTTVTILSDEILDVTYEFRIYPRTTDVTGSVTFTGNIGGTYDWTMRAANVTSASSTQGWTITTQAGDSMGGAGSAAGTLSYSGTAGAITGQPSGTTSQSTSHTVQAYSAGSLERRFSIVFDLDRGNLTGGLRSVRVKAGVGTFQVQFDPAIPKTLNDRLTLVYYHSWGRRP
jgi:hypothetical protein